MVSFVTSVHGVVEAKPWRFSSVGPAGLSFDLINGFMSKFKASLSRSVAVCRRLGMR